jgi:two-component system, OmpR family, sensor histidine kinase CpxA
MLLICWAVMLPITAIVLLVPSATTSLLDDRQRTLPLTLLLNCAQNSVRHQDDLQPPHANGECPPSHMVAAGIKARADLNGNPLSIDEARIAHRAELGDGISLWYLPDATLVAFRSNPSSSGSSIYLVSLPLAHHNFVMSHLNRGGRLLFSAGLFSLIVAAFFVRPVTRLSSVAQKFGDGDLKARVSPSLARRKDELGDLGRTFNSMAERIETLVNDYKSFLAHASHELGSPLTRLNIALALAKRKAVGKLEQEHERIGQEAERLNSLVQEMLLLARLESGNELSKKPVVFDAAQIAQEAYENASFESQQSRKTINLVSLESFLVRGYPELLARAIDNVLRNGLRFAHHQVRMQMSSVARATSSLGVIVIEDDGPGVPEGREEEIFAPFFTLPGEATNDIPRGSGLGLAIAQQAVLANGGRIFAKRSDTGGLMVVIEVPISSEPITATGTRSAG